MSRSKNVEKSLLKTESDVAETYDHIVKYYEAKRSCEESLKER